MEVVVMVAVVVEVVVEVMVAVAVEVVGKVAVVVMVVEVVKVCVRKTTHPVLPWTLLLPKCRSLSGCAGGDGYLA